MISIDSRIPFKQSKLLSKLQPQNAVTNSNAAVSRNSENVLLNKSVKHESSPKSNNIFNKLFGFFAMIVSGIASVTGIKALKNRPTTANKQLIKILDDRLANTNLLIKNMREVCEKEYDYFSKQIPLLKPKKNPQPDITKYNTELYSAKNITEVFAVENRFFNDIRAWMNSELGKNNSEETVSKMLEFQTQAKSKISEFKQFLSDQIEIHKNTDDIPEKLTKGKKAHKIISTFQEILSEKTELLEDAITQTDTLIATDIRCFQADMQKKSAQVIEGEKILSDNFLNEVKRKLSTLSETKNTDNHQLGTTALQSSDLPENIIVDTISLNPIFKFIEHPNKTTQDYVNFFRQLSETMNLKDIKILSDRLHLRTDAGLKQFTQSAKEADDLYEQCNNFLLGVFAKSGKNIDLKNINIKEIETAALSLSRAFGYQSIGQMITDILVKHSYKQEIAESALSNIYREYNKAFLENSTSDLIRISRSDNNLFNWEPLT